MENLAIARVLRDMADLFEIKGGNPFRIRAYRNAAEVVETNDEPLRQMVTSGADLTELPAIGKDMARHITELVTVGKSSTLAELAQEIPLSLIELTRLPGLGAKRAKKLWEELDVTTIDGLERAALDGDVEALAGFGKKTQQRIITSIERYRRHRARTKLDDADRIVVPLLKRLLEHPAVQQADVVGSVRRRCETVGDINLLIATDDPETVIESFAKFAEVERVENSTSSEITVVLESGIKADLSVVSAEGRGAALTYLTGSKRHNDKLRARADAVGLGFSRAGVYRSGVEGADSSTVDLVDTPDESDLYRAVGLPWIAPELREDRGEIEAAVRGELPELITIDDICGDLQMHSTWSDGKETIEVMLQACTQRGYDYFAITDHSKALAMTGGMNAAKLREQWSEIEEIAGRHGEIKILRGMEIDILADGRLDLEDEMLAQLDVVLISVHSRFDLPAADQTDRMIKAIQHPSVNILAHPTGRQINRRDPMKFDLDAVLVCAAECNVAVELNAHPNRLDLSDVELLKAREFGLKIVISTDAHSCGDLDLMSYGIEQARRAWVERGDVLNTLQYDELIAALGPV